MPRLILRLFYWELLPGQFEFLRPGLSAGFPFGGCLWKSWQEWEGVIASVDTWGSALGNLRLVSPLGDKGAGEWGVYLLTSPYSDHWLSSVLQAGRQTASKLWFVPARAEPFLESLRQEPEACTRTVSFSVMQPPRHLQADVGALSPLWSDLAGAHAK